MNIEEEIKQKKNKHEQRNEKSNFDRFVVQSIVSQLCKDENIRGQKTRLSNTRWLYFWVEIDFL